jgi:hypothetical protein
MATGTTVSKTLEDLEKIAKESKTWEAWPDSFFVTKATGIINYKAVMEDGTIHWWQTQTIKDETRVIYYEFEQ